MFQALLWGTVPLAVAALVARRPVSRRRLSGFAERHGLPGSAIGPRLVAYLSKTRRWRAAGVVAGYLATLVWTVPNGLVLLAAGPVLAGWLGGALLVEYRMRYRAVPASGDVPRTLPRVPAVVAGLAVTVTAVALVSTSSAPTYDPSTLAPAGAARTTVVAWGLAALCCALLVEFAGRYLARRPGWGDPVEERDAGQGGDALGRATVVNATGAITAVGVVLAALCVAQQLAIVSAHLFGQVRVAVAGVGTFLPLAAVVIAFLLVSATWARPVGHLDPRVPAFGVLALAVVGSAAWIGYGVRRDHPPYPASAIDATATVVFTDPQRFEADAATLGVAGLMPMVGRPGSRMFVGRVDYAVPAGAERGSYELVVIDGPTNTMLSNLYGLAGGGWSGYLQEVPRRYPWLSAMRPVQVGAGWTAPGMALHVAADRQGPLPFAGLLPQGSTEVPMVVLVFVGPDYQIYWAQEVRQIPPPSSR